MRELLHSNLSEVYFLMLDISKDVLVGQALKTTVLLLFFFVHNSLKNLYPTATWGMVTRHRDVS